ncbi:hypothetical protein [Candidatus Pantoea bituminis]|uniref:hypothetical protein n=1 Tax=Candidatus Pantoea bituminis TaxID=2831036 RepID=UPI001C05F9EC|nr:hypothetical protein [Pantoea bituminis]
MGSGISLWVSLISAGAGILGALGSQWLSHHFATARELRASEDKLARERYFIATELVFVLEQFAEACIAPACDAGTFDHTEGRRTGETDFPKFDYSSITGNWRVLPSRLIYRLREMIVLQEESRRLIHQSFDWDDVTDPVESFAIRQYQAARLGMKAKIQAGRLRKLCGMPSTALLQGQRSSGAILWKLWRIHRSKEMGRLITEKLFRDTMDGRTDSREGILP